MSEEMADQREEAGEKEACRDQIKESDKEEVGESRWVFLEIDGLTGCVCVCVCVCVGLRDCLLRLQRCAWCCGECKDVRNTDPAL